MNRTSHFLLHLFPLPLLYAAIATTFLSGAPAHAWDPSGIPVCTEQGLQASPRFVPDGSGGAIVAWQDSRNGVDHQLGYAMRLSADGAKQWTANGVSVTTPSSWGLITLAPDGMGGTFVGTTGCLDTVPCQSYAIFLQHMNGDGAPLWGDRGVVVCSAPGYRYPPEMKPDGTGGVVLVWDDIRDLYMDKIYAQRVSAAGVPMWTPNGIPVCSAASWQLDPSLVLDGSGGVIIAWSDTRNDVDGNIYAQHVTAAGGLMWSTEGLALVVRSAGAPVMVSDDRGGAIIAWVDSRTGYPNPDRNIYAQRVNGEGAPLWGVNGSAVCLAINDQDNPMVCSDGDGGAIVAWLDRRRWDLNNSVTPYLTDIYAQRMDASGTPRWNVDGIAVATGELDEPAITTDGAGGIVVAWTDVSHGTSAIPLRAQRVNGEGDLQWGLEGVLISSTALLNSPPALSPLTSGAAVVAWADVRNGTEADIYAQEVGLTNATVPAHRLERSLAIRTIAPNPSTGAFRVSLSLATTLPARLEVMDALGRRVLTRDVSGQTSSPLDLEIATGRLSPGIYLLRLRQGNHSDTRRVAVR